jgi:hypothetical protein
MRKHFIKLMEEVDPNYQPPTVEPNAGQGLTKFSPTPASKVLKNFTVDDGFLRNAMAWAGGQPQAIDQVIGALGNAGNGVLGGQHFDNIVATFTAPAGATGVGGELQTPGAGAPIPASPVAPVDATVPPVAANPDVSNIAPAEPAPVETPDASTAPLDANPETGPVNVEPTPSEPNVNEPVEEPTENPADEVGAEDKDGEELQESKK